MDFPLLLPAPRLSFRQKFRLWWPTAIATLLIVGLLSQLLQPVSSLENSFRKTQRWPQLPSSHFSLARALLQNGHEKLAQQEATLGKQQLDRFNLLLAGKVLQKDWQITQAVVYQKENLEEKLKEVDQLLSAYSYSWPLLIQKAIFHYRLYQDEQAQKSLEMAFWLNPGNKTIEAVADLFEER